MTEEKQQTLDTFGKVERRELPRLNLKPYIGQVTTIERYRECWTDDGRPYVIVETKPLAVFGDDDNRREIRASLVLGLRRDECGVYIGVGTKADKILESFRVTHWKDLIGKKAIVQLQPPRKSDGKEFLTFVPA